MLPPHLHGLQPLSFGLFHQQEVVREVVVDLFNELRAHPVCQTLISTPAARVDKSFVCVDRRAVPAGTQPFPAIRLRSASARTRATHERYQFSINTPVLVHDPDTVKS